MELLLSHWVKLISSAIRAVVPVCYEGNPKLWKLRRSLPCCIHLFKGFLRFYGVIQESMVSRNNSSPKLASASDSSMPHSSIGVSDAACLSYKKTDDKTARPQGGIQQLGSSTLCGQVWSHREEIKELNKDDGDC
ncbi:unnamed protein product [Musa acuminata subsp. burmannicoides]